MSEHKLPTLSTLLLDPKAPFIHRDISWIQFNDRVLAEARTRSNPIIKRMKFLSISTSNLDEFFMIRFASLVRSLSSKGEKENLTRIYGTVLDRVRRFIGRQYRTLKTLQKEAAEKGIYIHLKPHKDSAAFQMGKEIFLEILPQLIPRNTFKYTDINDLKNTQLFIYLNQNLCFEVPKNIPNVFWCRKNDHLHVFFLDDLLLSHLDHVIPLKEKPGILRITRDADFNLDLPEGDTESIPDIVRKSLSSRDKGRLVRMQYLGNFPKDFLEEAMDQLKIDHRQSFRGIGTICLHGLFSFCTSVPDDIANKPGLSNPPLSSMIPLPFEKGEQEKLYTSLRELDFILHHPYDSFDAYIEWLTLACKDPLVTMIEQTIYRTDSVSQIVAILKEAAPLKKVKVILELRARFDESNNLKVAEELRQAGVEVRFGFGSLKLHAKITLITRKENERIVRYTHLSTGNYNAKTARQYTDISIFSGNQEIGEDARHFFDSIFQNKVPSQFKHLVTAPIKLHAKIKTLIREETEAAKSGKKAKIIAKVNALVDEKIIEDLYLASQAGVSIDLIVRGACSLIPGVKGLSENIKVISIVDRFLEHSRIYYFQHSEVIYLSSADWMPRNFFSRLEIAFPVLDERIYSFIEKTVLPAYLKDNMHARRLTPRGIWEKVQNGSKENRAQKFFEELAKNRYENTPLYDHPFFNRSKIN